MAALAFRRPDGGRTGRARVVTRMLRPFGSLRSRNGAPARLDDAPVAPGREDSRRRAALDLGVLAALGVPLVALVGWMGRWSKLPDQPVAYTVLLAAQLAVYGLAVGWLIRRRPPARRALAIVFLVALAARLTLVPQVPTASDDIYRYVWDGRIQALGINPYRYAPNDPALARYRDEAIYSHVNRQGVPTIYPPVAQAAFRAVYQLHPDSVAWTKLAFVGLDLATVGVIAGLLSRLGLRPERALLYAWHPLLILELGHSGHVDVVAILFLALALRARLAGSPVWTGILLACATLIKFYAVVALPALLRPDTRRAWRLDPRLPLAFATTAALAYLPFLAVGPRVFGYLSGYVEEEGIASGRRFYLLQQVQRVGEWSRLGRLRAPAGLPLTAAQCYQLLLIAIMGALALWCWLRPLGSRREIADRVALLFVTLLALTTPTYPWYTLFALALLPLVGGRLLPPASALVGGAGFLYLQWWWPGGAHWATGIAYGAPAAALALAALWAAAGAVGRRWPWPRRVRPAVSRIAPEPGSLFDRFPRVYAFCREYLFRDHTRQIVGGLWPEGTPPAGSRLLELGCGPGFYARRLAARFAGLRVTGIDRAEGQLHLARSRAEARRLANCSFEWGDALALARPAGAVDAIVASRLCTILPARERALAEMHRVLRPGGRCFIAEPRSPLWTAAPLRLLWLLAGLATLHGAGCGAYREPRRAMVLTVEEFGALVESQPWARVRRWHDARYHYAVCEKGVVGIVQMAAD